MFSIPHTFASEDESYINNACFEKICKRKTKRRLANNC